MKLRALRSNTNYLLMLTSLFEAMHETWSLVFLVVALSGQNFIRFDTSFWLQSLAIFGVTAAQIAMAATSIDRLLAVGFPISYAFELFHFPSRIWVENVTQIMSFEQDRLKINF